MARKKRIFMVSLGCAKNLVDSEQMLGFLAEKGYSSVSRLERADIGIVNTCGFIQPAVEEAIDTILELAERKKRGKLGKLYVTGCLVQRYGYKLRKEIPEVDGWLGTGEIPRICQLVEDAEPPVSRPFLIHRPGFLGSHDTPRVQTTPFYTTYLKIAEGCSHGCTYCLIPRLRGPFRSRAQASLLLEAERAARAGVKEINLVAQDTTAYGRDLGGGVCLETLLEALVKVPGVRWVRLLYCHPARISDGLLDLMESEEIICPYLDLPLQHVNPDVLEAMGRTGVQETPWELIERIRCRKRRISLRTTLMVGFPGETEDAFEELCAFTRAVAFDHLGVFVFSPEAGTRAARLGPVVKGATAKRRLETLLKIQAGISEAANRSLVGRSLPVLIEGPCQESALLLQGRTASMAPEVDGRVLINKGEGVVGDVMPVRITEAHAYDLVGELEA